MGSTTITVTPAGVPFPGNTAAGAYDDTLTVTTTAPNATPVAVPLTELASGAVLTVSAPSTAFGTVAGSRRDDRRSFRGYPGRSLRSDGTCRRRHGRLQR